MTACGVALAALAVLVFPAPGRGRRRAVLRCPSDGAGRGVVAGGAARSVSRRLVAFGRRRWVAATGVATGVALLGVVPVLPAVCFGAVGALLVHLGWRAGQRRVVARGADTAVQLVGALADELRAGRPPPQALTAVATHHVGPIAAVLAEAARTDGLGGDTETVLRTSSWTVVGGEHLGRLAAAWALSRSSGCSLADVLDAVAADLRARRRQDRLLVSLLAGPRASAGLLAGLPLIGLLMGAGLGADPLRVLTTTGPGQLALAAGIGLDVAGLLWTDRIVRGAGG